ncbi:MAG TPA: hypothetical protein VNC41_08180 [Acidimicrobiia bacterium]|nr:hypothetical protein [Acidimicrobiia bacterium]
MDARSTIADLLRLGFAVEKKNDLWFVGFPDGADGRVLDVDQLASLNVGALKELANRRRQAIDGIRALLAHAGWGMLVNAGGTAELGLGGASSYIDIGLPLTFWLQRSGLVPTLRRFVDGFVRDLDDRTIERVRRVDAQTRSRELYDAHLAQCAAIEANAVELETDPAEQAKRMAEIETYRRDAEREHRAWVDARRVPGSVDEQLRAVLAQSRSDMRAGNGLWLGGLPLWASDADDNGSAGVSRAVWQARAIRARWSASSIDAKKRQPTRISTSLMSISQGSRSHGAFCSNAFSVCAGAYRPSRSPAVAAALERLRSGWGANTQSATVSSSTKCTASSRSLSSCSSV